MDEMKILAVGNVFESNSIIVDEFCKNDSEETILDLFHRTSGAAIVVSAIAAFLGKNITLLSKSKTSSTLSECFNLLSKHNVSIRLIDSEDTNVLLTIYDKSLHRKCYAFTPACLDIEDLKEIDFSEFDLTFFCCLPYERIASLFESNSTLSDTHTVVIASGLTKTYFVNKALMPRIDFLFLNKDELICISDKPENDIDMLNLVKDLSINDTSIVVTNGKDGIFGKVGDVFFKENVSSIDTIIHPGGAGDSFATGFMVSFLEGKTLQECCRIGHNCASLMLSHRSVADFLREYGRNDNYEY